MNNLSPPLFFNKKERLIFLLFLITILSCTLSYKYYQFHTLKSQKSAKIEANVLLQYTKMRGDKSYYVLKLQSNFGTFYTTSWEDLKNLKNKRISLNIILKQVSFVDFLKGFYAPSFNLSLLQGEDFRKPLRDFILSQHQTQLMGEYYLSLFLSDPLPLPWRDLAQSYGIAHIFAISGYHTGILSAIGFFILGLIYSPLHKRYFPYRNRYFDLGMLVLLLLIVYYFLLTQSPSYLRALAMSCVAFFLIFKGLDILKLESFFWSIGILLSFFPSLIFSVGFYFSSFGVLYILLFFKYFKIPRTLFQKLLYGFFLNVFTFFLMGVIVYYFFPPFSPLSLTSLIFTPLFTLYYPLILLAHFFGFGGLLDLLLLWWVNIDTHTITLQPNLFFFLFCNFLTLLAIFYRYAFYTLFGVNLIYYIYGIYLFTKTP